MAKYLTIFAGGMAMGLSPLANEKKTDQNF